jgi:hypothetical protein
MPDRKEVITLKINQKQAEQQRRELLDLLYTMIEELENNPSMRRRESGFFFSWLVGGISKTLDGLEGLVAKKVVPLIEKQLDRWKR